MSSVRQIHSSDLYIATLRMIDCQITESADELQQKTYYALTHFVTNLKKNFDSKSDQNVTCLMHFCLLNSQRNDVELIANLSIRMCTSWTGFAFCSYTFNRKAFNVISRSHHGDSYVASNVLRMRKIENNLINLIQQTVKAQRYQWSIEKQALEDKLTEQNRQLLKLTNEKQCLVKQIKKWRKSDDVVLKIWLD